MNTAAPAPPPGDDALAEDPRWALVQRVAGSPALERSKRLQQFLLYVGERALRDPGRPVTEQEIRRDVFGRPTDLDAMADTVVRVQASHLRRRLEQYFATSGTEETLVVEIPRGSYAPIFRDRADVLPAARGRGASGRFPAWPQAILIAALALACAVLALDARRARRGAEEAAAARLGPSVDRLWREMFGDAPVYVVLADANLSLFQDTLKYQLSLPEYQRQDFVKLGEARLPPHEVPLSWRLMNREYTSIGDATLAYRVARVSALQGRAADVVLARRADPGQFQSHNAILSGPRRLNPWVALFEERLNFQSRFEEGTRRAWLHNADPRPGEAAEYPVEWNKVGYGRVAYLPSLKGGAGVLLLSGIDSSSTDACADFVTNETRVRDLFQRLGVAAGTRIPYFEVLLRTTLLLGTTSQYEVVTHRRIAGT